MRVPGAGPWLAAACKELQSPQTRTLHQWRSGGVALDVRQGRDALWLVARWSDHQNPDDAPREGGVAFRLAWSPDGLEPAERSGADDAPELRAHGALGTWRVTIQSPEPGADMVRWTSALTPDLDLLVPFWPRDIYPLDAHDNPLGVGGIVHATQNNTGTGFLYASLTRPRTGSFLYVQNLTALNDYCLATRTEPGCVVAGHWPELGLRLPPSEDKPLPAGREIVMSDALVRLHREIPENERHMARLFLDMLNDIYPHLSPPDTEYHHWPTRAAKTLHSLESCEACHVPVDGRLYLHPFLDAEPPDSLTQVAAVKDMRAYAKWLGHDLDLEKRLAEGLPAFYNREIGTLMRYLSGCAGPWEKEGDSWYHYVPLGSLGWMARDGDEAARRLFLDSLEWAIRCARHFEYRWPVMFDVKTFEVLRGEREPGQPGETDVGGVYAHAMMVAYDLTGEERYLREAENAIRAMEGFGFNVVYETGVTAWGAYGALRVWKANGDPYFLEQSTMLLAGFMQNVFLWESELGPSKHFPLFFGVKAMYNLGYKASYEIHDAFSAFHDYLKLGGDKVAPSVRALLSEYCRHALHAAWYAFPEELPEDIIATEQEYGRVDRGLSLPLEDLSAGWDKVGTVGQQVYGANIAFVFLSQAYHRSEGAPFVLFIDVPVAEERVEERRLTLRLGGDPRFPARIRLLPREGETLPEVRVTTGSEAEEIAHGRSTEEGHREFRPASDATLTFTW